MNDPNKLTIHNNMFQCDGTSFLIQKYNLTNIAALSLRPDGRGELYSH